MTSSPGNNSANTSSDTAAASQCRTDRVRRGAWLRKLVLTTLAIIVLVVGIGGYYLYRSGVRPAWYGKMMSEQARAAAQKTATAKILGVQNWAQDGRLYSSSQERPDKLPSDPTTAPSATHTLTLTEDELNSFLEPHQKALLAKFGQWIDEPYISLHDSKITIGVMLKDTGRVLAVHVTPTISNDGLKLVIDRLSLGEDVTIPKFLWNGYLRKIGEQCRPKLDAHRNQAGWLKNELYRETDMANEHAVYALFCRLVLRSIEQVDADPVLFLPVEGKYDRGGHPMMVSRIAIKDSSISLTFQPLTKDERSHLMARIRAEYGQEPPPALAATTRPTTPIPGP